MTVTDQGADVEQWGLFELAMQGSSGGNPFLDVELTAQFSQEQRTVEVDRRSIGLVKAAIR